MKPGYSFYGWLVERSVISNIRTGYISFRKRAVVFGVNLLNATEAAELTFAAVEVPVMVTVGGREFRIPPVVRYGYSLDTMYGERKLRDPGFASKLVSEIKLRGRRVFDLCLSAQIVTRLDKQMRLLPSHQVDVSHGVACGVR